MEANRAAGNEGESAVLNEKNWVGEAQKALEKENYTTFYEILSRFDKESTRKKIGKDMDLERQVLKEEDPAKKADLDNDADMKRMEWRLYWKDRKPEAEREIQAHTDFRYANYRDRPGENMAAYYQKTREYVTKNETYFAPDTSVSVYSKNYKGSFLCSYTEKDGFAPLSRNENGLVQSGNLKKMTVYDDGRFCVWNYPGNFRGDLYYLIKRIKEKEIEQSSGKHVMLRPWGPEVRDELVKVFSDELLHSPKTTAQEVEISAAQEKGNNFEETNPKTAVNFLKQWKRVEIGMLNNLVKSGTLMGEKLPPFPHYYSKKNEGYTGLNSENYLIAMLDARDYDDPRFVTSLSAIDLNLTGPGGKDLRRTSPTMWMTFTNFSDGGNRRTVAPSYNATLCRGQVPEMDKGLYLKAMGLTLDEVKKNLQIKLRYNKDHRAMDENIAKDPACGVRELLNNTALPFASKDEGRNAIRVELATAYLLHAAGSRTGVKVEDAELLKNSLREDIKSINEKLTLPEGERDTAIKEYIREFNKNNHLMYGVVEARKSTYALTKKRMNYQKYKVNMAKEIREIRVAAQESQKELFNGLALTADADLHVNKNHIVPKGTVLKDIDAYNLLTQIKMRDRELYESQEHGTPPLWFTVDYVYTPKNEHEERFSESFNMPLGSLDSGTGDTVVSMLEKLSEKPVMAQMIDNGPKNKAVAEALRQQMYREEQSGRDRMYYSELNQKDPKRCMMEIYHDFVVKCGREKIQNIKQNLRHLEQVEGTHLSEQNELAKSLQKKPDVYQYIIPRFDDGVVRNSFGSSNVLSIRNTVKADGIEDRNSRIVTLKESLTFSDEKGYFLDERKSQTDKFRARPLVKPSEERAQQNFQKRFKVELSFPGEDETKRFFGTAGRTFVAQLINYDRTIFEGETKTGFKSPQAKARLTISYDNTVLTNSTFIPGDYSLGKYAGPAELIKEKNLEEGVTGRGEESTIAKCLKGLRADSKYETDKSARIETEKLRSSEKAYPPDELDTILKKELEPLQYKDNYKTMQKRDDGDYLSQKAVCNGAVELDDRTDFIVDTLAKKYSRKEDISAVFEQESLKNLRPYLNESLDRKKIRDSLEKPEIQRERTAARGR